MKISRKWSFTRDVFFGLCSFSLSKKQFLQDIITINHRLWGSEIITFTSYTACISIAIDSAATGFYFGDGKCLNQQYVTVMQSACNSLLKIRLYLRDDPHIPSYFKDQRVICPMSGRPLKIKELMPVKFTKIADGDEATKWIAKKVRYMCPVTHDALTNTTRCAYLKTRWAFVYFYDWHLRNSKKRKRQLEELTAQRLFSGWCELLREC